MRGCLTGLLLLSASLGLAHGTDCPLCDIARLRLLARCYPMNIAVLVPLPDEDYHPAFDQGDSIVPAVELAAEHINGKKDLLPCFKLVPSIKDAGCDKPPKTGLATARVFREFLISRNAIQGIIGPACSEASIFTTNTFSSRRNRLPFRLPVFYGGTTPYLSENAEAFPDAYGMISSADILIDMLIMIAEEENWSWKNVAVVYDESRQHFSQTYTSFANRLRSNGSQEVGYTRQIADSQIPLREIVDRNIRIVVVFSDKKPARQVACLAGQSEFNFVFPIRQFIFIERTLEDFLGDENVEQSFTELSVGKTYYCGRDTVMRGLNGSVLLNQALDSVDPDVMTVSNYTAGQVKQQYKDRLYNKSLPESSVAYAYYDAMWALALGLHSGRSSPNPFEVVHDTIRNISFQGVSSWIDFKDRQHVSNDVIISQVARSGLMIKGLRTRNDANLTYSTETFISDKFKREISVLHDSLAALGFLLVIVLFIATLVIQILMMVYRDYPSVKASSSRLNNFIYLGCYLLTVAMAANTFRRTVPSTNGDVLCNLDVMICIVACTLISGTILAKSWRTYRIFNHVFKSRSKYSLHDVTLSAFILALTLLQVVLFIPMLVVSPFQQVTSSIYDTSQWPPIERVQPVCSTQSVGYLILPVLFLLCIVLATVVLATLNRKIRRKNFRRTKQVIVLVYTLTIMWAIGSPLLVLFYYLDLSQDFIYFFYTFLLTITVFLCQILLIIPFLIPVASNSGRKVSRLNSNNSSYTASRRRSSQLSLLSNRRLSFLIYAFRRSSMEPQLDHRSSIQINAKRRSSLPPNSIKHHIHPPIRNNSTSTMTSSLQSCNSLDSPTSLQSGLTISQSSIAAIERQKTRMTLHSISENIDD